MKSIRRVKEGNGSGLPCAPHVEGIGATEERGVKAPSSLGQGKQLEPTWKVKDVSSPLTMLMACCSLGPVGVHLVLVWGEWSVEGIFLHNIAFLLWGASGSQSHPQVRE